MSKFSEAFKRFTGRGGAANDNLKTLADESLTIDRSQRAGPVIRSLIKHAGGYDSKYYTASEARSSTTLAAAKFASVSFATYAVMKAINPAFNNEAIQNLPAINGIDPSLLAKGIIAGGVWWGISTLDTAVLHGMRSAKAARKAFQEYDLGDASTGRTPFSGILLRAGISAGSLAITIPALLVTVSQQTIDQYLLEQPKYQANLEIVEEYRERITSLEETIETLVESRATLEENLADLQEQNFVITDAQETQLETLITRLAEVRRLRAEENSNLNGYRDDLIDAEDRMEQEDLGLRGSLPGRGDDYNTADLDRQTAEDRIANSIAIIAAYDEEIESLETRIQAIQTTVDNQTTQANESVARDRGQIQGQLARLTTQIGEQRAILEAQPTAEEAARNDERFLEFEPDLTERADGYGRYMLERGGVTDWTVALATALIIISMEIGVFAMASSRKINAGEFRGYMADLAKSDQAIDVYRQIKDKLAFDEETESYKTAERQRENATEALKAEIFEEALQKAKEDPEILESALNEIMEELKRTWSKETNGRTKPTSTPS